MRLSARKVLFIQRNINWRFTARFLAAGRFCCAPQHRQRCRGQITASVAAVICLEPIDFRQTQMRLLFWNMQKKDAPPEFSAFCQAKSVDIVLLAEPGRQAKHLGDTLTVSGTAEYVRQVQRTTRFEVFSRQASHQMLPKHDSNRFSIWHIKPSAGADIILIVLHLLSKMHAKPSELVSALWRI